MELLCVGEKTIPLFSVEILGIIVGGIIACSEQGEDFVECLFRLGKVMFASTLRDFLHQGLKLCRVAAIFYPCRSELFDELDLGLDSSDGRIHGIKYELK